MSLPPAAGCGKGAHMRHAVLPYVVSASCQPAGLRPLVVQQHESLCHLAEADFGGVVTGAAAL